MGVFTFLCMIFSSFSSQDHSSGLSKLNLTSCNTFCDIFYINDPAFNQKILEKLIFKKFCVEITQKNDTELHKNVKTDNDPSCL